jgi:hypothetical protein
VPNLSVIQVAGFLQAGGAQLVSKHAGREMAYV